MLLLRSLTALLFFGLLMEGLASPQTPPLPEYAGIGVTFTTADVMGAMTDSERLEFQELRLKMKKNKTSQQQVADDPDSVALLQSGFEKLESDFESKFGYLRGIRNQMVTVYGIPLPSRGEIMDMVVNRRLGGGDPTLYPHWYRDDFGGGVIGATTKPSFESGPRAGEVFEAQVRIEGTRAASTGSDSEGASCEQLASREGLPGESCRCEEENRVFGVPNCYWTDEPN